MEYIEKIKFLSERFELTNMQLASMLGISRAKVKKYLDKTKEITERDAIKIDRAIKVQKYLSRHVAIDEEIKNQEFLISNLLKKEINLNLLEGIVAESMYLGLMLANKNEDEYVLRRVRAWRKWFKT